MFQRLSNIFLLISFCIFLFFSFVLSQDQNKKNGINYINEGKYRQAVKELEKVILENPSDAESLFYLGIAYRNLGSGQLRNALSGISQALKIKPNDPNWQYALAQTYDDMDKFGISLTDTNKTTYELAVEAYTKAIAFKDRFKEAHLSLGELFLRKGKYELASEKFKDVIKIDPQNESSYSYLVDCLCKLDRYDEAITNLNKWSAINANKIEPHNLKAKIYWYQGKYEDAQREYQKVIDLDPANQLARARLDTIEVIIQNKNRINELLTRGESLFNARQYDQAIVQFEEIRKINPNHSIANERLREARTRLSDYWFNSGLDRVRNNDLEGAVENFNRALKYVQSRSQMNTIIQSWQQAQIALGERAKMYELKQIGERYILEKKYSLAKTYLDVFNRESKLNEQGVKIALDSLGIAALYQAASENEHNGFWIEALAFYLEIFKFDSTFRDVKHRVEKLNGEIAFSNKDWEKAILYFARAVQIDSSQRTETMEKISKAKNEIVKTKIIKYSFMIIISILAITIIFLSKIIIKNKTKSKQINRTLDEIDAFVDSYVVEPSYKKQSLEGFENPYIVGKPICDDNLFIGRTNLITKILESIKGNSFFIYGPKRIGKTSLLLKLKQELDKKEKGGCKFYSVFSTLQGVDENELFTVFVKSLYEEFKYIFEGDRIIYENLKKINEFDFTRYIKRVLKVLEERSKPKNFRLIFLIDEADQLSKFAENTTSQLRVIFSQKNYSDNLGIILAGISLYKKWEAETSPWYNFLIGEKIPPLSIDDTISLIKKPVSGLVNYSEGAIINILKFGKLNPFLTQKICKEAFDYAKEKRESNITGSDILMLIKKMDEV